jgi:hypothetical protein
MNVKYNLEDNVNETFHYMCNVCEQTLKVLGNNSSDIEDVQKLKLL